MNDLQTLAAFLAFTGGVILLARRVFTPAGDARIEGERRKRFLMRQAIEKK